MENVLYINVDDLNIEFLLVTSNQSMKKNNIYVDKLYEYDGIGFGYKIIEVAMAQHFLIGKKSFEELEKVLTLYHESLLIGKSYSIEDTELSQEFDLLLLQARKETEKQIDSAIIENSGIKEKMEALFKRVRFETFKYPIDHIILLDKQIPLFWFVQLINDVFRDIPIEVNKGDFPVLSSTESKTEIEKNLFLRYQNESIPIMTLSTEVKEVLKNAITFKIKFSLDTHIQLAIYESWREKGLTKEKNVTHFSFNLPFFYTDDVIQIMAIFDPVHGYFFKVIHVETGEEAHFI